MQKRNSVYSNLRKQIMYAKSIRFYSIISIILFAALIIFSFLIDQANIIERNSGRDIHTNQFNLIDEVYILRAHICSIYFYNDQQIATQRDINNISADVKYIETTHSYLLSHSVDSKSFSVFLSGERSYGVILLLSELVTNKWHQVTKSDIQLVMFYTSQYELVINKFYDMYTSILARNNLETGILSYCVTFFEIALLCLLLFAFIIPCVKKFIAASEASEQNQRDILAVREKVNETISNKRSANILAKDVICSDLNRYEVARGGQIWTVFYNEKSREFYCRCSIYLQSKTCFDVQRAKWLHNRIYRASGVVNDSDN